METVFTVWIIAVIAALVIFMIGIFVDLWVRSRRGRTEQDRADAKMKLRNMLISILTTSGLSLGGSNIRAMMVYAPYDPVPQGVRIALAMVGVGLFIAAIVMAVRYSAQAHQKS